MFKKVSMQICIIILLLVMGCKVEPLPTAPQYNNPYDPKSPNFQDELALGNWILIQKKDNVDFLSPEFALDFHTCYLLGGTNSSSNSVLNNMYSFNFRDTVSNVPISFRNEKPMLFPRKNFSATIHNGIIYAFGGDTANSAEAYNLFEDRWFSLGNLPSDDMVLGSSIIKEDSYFLIIGGKSKDGKMSKKIWLYNPFTNLWSMYGDFPVGIESPAVLELANKLYVIGGFDSTGRASSKIYVSDSGEWSLFPATLNEARGNCVALAKGNRIYIFGGENEFGAFSLKVEEIKVKDGKCIKKADIPYPIKTYGSINYEGKMMLVGGAKGGPLMVLEFRLPY